MQTGITGINAICVYSPMKQMLDYDPVARCIKAPIPDLVAFTAEEITAFATTTLGTYLCLIIDFKKVETKIMKDALYGLKKSPASCTNTKRIYEKHSPRKRKNIHSYKKACTKQRCTA